MELRQYEERTAPIGRIQFKKTNRIKKRLVVTLKNNEKQKAMVEECEEGPSTADTQRIGQAMRSVSFCKRTKRTVVIKLALSVRTCSNGLGVNQMRTIKTYQPFYFRFASLNVFHLME